MDECRHCGSTAPTCKPGCPSMMRLRPSEGQATEPMPGPGKSLWAKATAWAQDRGRPSGGQLGRLLARRETNDD